MKSGPALPIVDAFKQAAADNGLEYSEKVGEGDLNKGADGITSCIREKASVIFTLALENSVVATQLKAAEDAGIPVIAVSSGAPVPGVVSSIALNELTNTANLVAYAKTEMQPKLNFMLLKVSPLPVGRERIDSFATAIKNTKGWTLADASEIDLTSVADGTSTLVAGALRKHPDINVIVSPWGDPAAGAAAAIRSSGKDVKILTYDADEPTLAGMRAGSSPVVAITSFPFDLVGTVLTQQVGELLDGKEITQQYMLCTGPLITDVNIPEKDQTAPGGNCLVDGQLKTEDELKAAN